MLQRRFLVPAFSLLVLVMFADAGPAFQGSTPLGSPPAKDQHGDALPPGAVARLGTVRCRHDSPIVFAGFHPGGKSVVSASVDGVICAWEFPSGRQLSRFEAQPAAERKGEPAATVTKASLSQDGKHVTAFCTDGHVRIWDWADAQQMGKVANGGGNVVNGFGALGGGLGALGGSLGAFGGGVGGSNFDHAYSPDGKALLLAASPRVLQFVDFPTGKDIGPSLGHTNSLTSVAFSADGAQLLTQDSSSTRSWNAITRKEMGTITVKVPAGVGNLGGLLGLMGAPILSPDGRVSCTVGQSFGGLGGGLGQTMDVALHDTTSGKVLHKIPVELGPAFNLPSVQFSPDSKTLAVHVDAKHKIELYDITSGKLQRTLEASAAAQPAQGFGLLGQQPLQKMLYFADGKALAFQASPGAAIAVRDTATGNEIAALVPVKGSQAMQRAFSPDRRCLALAMSDGTVTLYELATGQPRRTYGTKWPPPSAADNDPLAALAALGGGIGAQMFVDHAKVSVAIAPGGKLLALSGPGGSVHLWDAVSGEELTVLKGHTAAVTALVFAPNAKTLASASADTTALLWDVTTIKGPAGSAKALAAADLEKRWQALVDSDAAKAWAAVGDLVAASRDTVAFLKERVRPAAPLDVKRVEELLAQLDSNQYKVRELASGDLLKIGDQIVPSIDKALAANPPLEMKKRLEDLRGTLTSRILQGERLGVYRAVEVLELIGTPEARQLLQTLADGGPGALVTTSAQAALKR